MDDEHTQLRKMACMACDRLG